MSIAQKAKKLIPARFHYTLSLLRNNFLGYKNIYYSQFGEDIILKTIFKATPAGYYVDVGAHHPKRYSNTYLLYKKGWHGMNIDPNPHSITLFNKTRPGDKNVQCGVGPEDALTYYRFSDPAVNTFDKDEAEKWMGKDWIEFLGTATIPVHPLASIIPPEQSVDLLTIDTEGMDMAVLMSNDWNTCKPRVVVVESSSDEIPAYMGSLGYVQVAFVGKSLVFVIS